MCRICNLILGVSFPFSVVAAQQTGTESGQHVAVQSSKASKLGKISLPALACLQDLGFVSLFMFKACCPILHNRCLRDLYDKGGGSLFYEHVAAWLIIYFVMIIIFCFVINIVYFNCLDSRNQWNF